MFLSLLLVVLVSLVISGCTGKKGNSEGPIYITNQEKFYQFKRPDPAWKKKKSDQFSEYRFVRGDHSTICIDSSTFTASLTWVQYSRIGSMQKKYKWKSMEIIEEGKCSMVDPKSPWFLKASAIWTVIEYKKDSRTWKEKIYLVEGDKSYYRLRLSCPKRYFDRRLEEFEQLAKNFEPLKETSSSTEQAAKDKEALGPTKPADEISGEVPSKQATESFERPEWKRGDQWTFRYRISTEGGLYTAFRKVVGKKKFEGTVCYITKGSPGLGIKWYWTLDLNLKAFVSQGEIQFKCIPDHPLLNWPLEVGKTWKRTYVYQEKDREPETREAEFKVVKKEKVEVPAGEFWTLKIVEKVNGSIHEEVWYSPKVKMFVKQKAYWIGEGVMTWELLEYKV